MIFCLITMQKKICRAPRTQNTLEDTYVTKKRRVDHEKKFVSSILSHAEKTVIMR